jgi:uncharacterized RDD family membrane protein YckC
LEDLTIEDVGIFYDDLVYFSAISFILWLFEMLLGIIDLLCNVCVFKRVLKALTEKYFLTK